MSAHRTPSDQAAASWLDSDPGTGKPLPTSGRQAVGTIPLKIGSGAETNTLADPERAGLTLVLTCYSVSGGSRAVTAATKVNQTANTVMTFAQEADTVELRSIPYASNTNKARWHIVANDGVALS